MRVFGCVQTGTLTQNVMRFLQCSINGNIYGARSPFSHTHSHSTHTPLTCTHSHSLHSSVHPFTAHPGKEAVVGQAYTGFIDSRLQSALDARDARVLEFFEHLAVCQTVRPEHSEDGSIDYQAQSPDEKALVEAAR